MGCSGSKQTDTARTEWEELVGKNTVAKVLDQQWKDFNNGTRGKTIQWATEAEAGVTAKSVTEIETYFKKFVDFEVAEKEGTVEIFKFENAVGEPDAIEAEAAEEEFEAEAAAVEEVNEEHKKEEEELEKKVEEGTATEEEKKEVEVEQKKEELEKTLEGGDKTPAAFRAFLENGVWAHKPAAMKAGETGGRTFGGGWKRRYLALAKGEDVLDYGEGPGKASKGAITFKEIKSVERLTADEAKTAKAPAKVANFCFVVKTATLRINFGCETADDADLAVEALHNLAIPKEAEEVKEEEVVVCEDGLLKVSVSVKPKEGNNKIFYHQFQYHLTEEEVEAQEEKKEEQDEKKAEEEEKKEEAAEKEAEKVEKEIEKAEEVAEKVEEDAEKVEKAVDEAEKVEEEVAEVL
eukprot:45000_1